MLISFTGAQSTGKSTLLQACKTLDIFKDYTFVEEVTRRLKKTHKIHINADRDNYDYAQLMIIADHVNNLKITNGVLDRCLIDGFLYTYYLYIKGKVSYPVSRAAADICEEYINKYDIIFLTEADIPLVNDGERSIDTEFRDTMITSFDRFCTDLERRQRPKVVRLRGSVEERMELIKKAMANS